MRAHRQRRRIGLLSTLVLIACARSESPTAPQNVPLSPSITPGASAEWFADYTIIDLGVLSGGDQSTARAINDHGDVVGWSTTDTNASHQHAFLWHPGLIALHDLGVLNPGESSMAVALNREGDVVGTSGGRAVFWDDGVQIHALAGASGFSPAGINSHDVIAGLGDVNNCPIVATWTSQHHVVGVPPFVGPCCDVIAIGCSDAAGINDREEIAGTVQEGTSLHAFMVDAQNHVHFTGELPGYAWSEATAISRFGHVTGVSNQPDEFGVVFVWNPEGEFRQVGPFHGDEVDQSNGMNDHDAIVGWSREAGFFGQCMHPFVWTGASGMKLLPSLTGFHTDNLCVDATVAYGVNNQQEIVGESTVPGHPNLVHAVLWRPNHPVQPLP